MIATVLLITATVLSFLAYIYSKIRRPKNFPPGPRWLPIAENFYEIRKLNKTLGGLHLAFQKLSEQFKTNVVGLKLAGNYVIAVQSEHLVRNVLLTEAYEGKPNNFFLRTRCMGALRGIVCVDGPLWAEQRNFIVRHLKYAGYGKKSMEYLINEELTDIIETLATVGPDVEFMPAFALPILNIVWTLLTGSRVHHTDPRLQSLLSLLNERGKAFDMAGGSLNQFPWLRHIAPNQIGYNLLRKINREMKELFMDTIKQHHDTWEPGKKDNLIYTYITEMNRCEENKETFTDDQLTMIFLDLFLGASQTSGTTLTFLLLRMLLHPDVQEKAFQVVNESLDPNKPLYYADRVKVPYIEAIIHEASRVYPISALAAPRRALRDTVLDGYNIPAGTTVYANIYAVHHSNEYWEDPEVFRPERFLDDKGNVHSTESVMTFGLGKRRCLGELLARQCIFIFFVGILRKYQICPIPNTPLPSPIPGNGIFLTPQKYKARLISRVNNNK